MSPLSTHIKILDGAIRLLQSTSPLGIRASSIADAAGVSPSLVKYHFRTLELLLTEAAIKLYVEEAAAERMLLEAEGSPPAVLRAWHQRRRAWMLEHKFALSLLSGLNATPVERHPQWRKAEQLLVDGLAPVISQIHREMNNKEARDTARQWLLITLVTDLTFTEIYQKAS